MIEILSKSIKHVSVLSGRLAEVFGAGFALVGAIDANTIQLWGGVAIALLAAAWSHFRDQRKRDFDDGERREMLKAMVHASIRAADEGKPDPFPWLSEFLIHGDSPRGKVEATVCETKEPALGQPGAG